MMRAGVELLPLKALVRAYFPELNYMRSEQGASEAPPHSATVAAGPSPQPLPSADPVRQRREKRGSVARKRLPAFHHFFAKEQLPRIKKEFPHAGLAEVRLPAVPGCSSAPPAAQPEATRGEPAALHARSAPGFWGSAGEGCPTPASALTQRPR